MENPGMIPINPAALLPTSTTKLSSSFVEKVADFSPESTGVMDVAMPATSTVSVVKPTFRVTLMLRFSAPANVIPAALYTENPFNSTDSSYVKSPTEREANVKYPSALVTVSRIEPDCSFRSLTVAPGTTACAGSETTPVRVAYMDCAGKLVTSKVINAIATRNLLIFVIVWSTPCDLPSTKVPTVDKEPERSTSSTSRAKDPNTDYATRHFGTSGIILPI